MAGDAAHLSVENDLTRLGRELRQAFRRWPDQGSAPDGEAGWGDDRFDELALRAFRLQHRGNGPYRRYCQRRGVEPGSVSDWRAIPPVPTAGFRAVPLIVGDPDRAELEFRTSGTSGRLDRRGRHLVRDPALYRGSLEAGFRAFVLSRCPRADEPPPMLSLIPPFSDAPHSSLSWMVDAVMERFAASGGRHAAAAGGIRWETASSVAASAVAAGRPLVVLTTTLALAEWTGRLAREGRRLSLPAGSLVMDTGGAKGRTGLERSAVIAGAEERLGVPRRRVVNEFGMTELLSQRYTLPPGRGPGSGGEERPPNDESPWLAAPPWLRSRALDPETLEELPEGEVGLLCHLDLANAGSVCAVLTEDLGRARSGRIQYLGRAGGSPPRGCSLATADLLRAAGERADTDWSVGTSPSGSPASSGTP